ncbi:hypothetical protein D3C73_1438290 [compost metagenome]
MPGVESLVELVALADGELQVDLWVQLPELAKDPGKAGDSEVVGSAKAEPPAHG